jgi:hypothetical protein
MAAGFNTAILFLLVAPFVIVSAGLIVFLSAVGTPPPPDELHSKQPPRLAAHMRLRIRLAIASSRQGNHLFWRPTGDVASAQTGAPGSVY